MKPLRGKAYDFPLGVLGASLKIQNITDLLGQDLAGEGLMQEGNFLAPHALADEGVVGIAGDVEEIDLRPQVSEAADQLRAPHFRHDHVSDDQVNGGAVLLT